MADPTQDEIDAARLADLKGLTSIRDADKGATYDAAARRRAIEQAERRLRRPPLCGYVRCSKGT